MAMYDISVPISETLVVWPGDPSVEIEKAADMEAGDSINLSHLTLSAHTGTHVDAPRHFIQGGAGIDSLALEVLVGPALVVSAPDMDVLSAEVLEALDIPAGTERVLFQTRNSELWAAGKHGFDEEYVAIAEDGAQWLVRRGVKLVGVDYLSVAPYSDPTPTHKTLLGAGIITVEGLNLSGIESGLYQLVCLPLNIPDCDGAPARAILVA